LTSSLTASYNLWHLAHPTPRISTFITSSVCYAATAAFLYYTMHRGNSRNSCSSTFLPAKT
jgi:hypothetical protein